MADDRPPPTVPPPGDDAALMAATAMTLVSRAQDRALSLTRKLDGVGPLMARLTLGVTFAGTGWGKLAHLDEVTDFFVELGIPAPHFQATLVGATELVGGALILVGLLTRLAALPLIVTMVVAIVTAKQADISGVADLLGTTEWVYLVMFAWLALAGAGRFSLDAVVVQWRSRRAVLRMRAAVLAH